MSSFRFIHAADIHLDSPLKGLSGLEESVTERIRSATRLALIKLVDVCINEKVDFLIIAGDLYDGDWPDVNTGLFFSSQMGRLNEEKIPVYLIYGNHDAESQITRKLALPDNVHVFDHNKPNTFLVDKLDIAIHGQSYKNRDIKENLAVNYPDPIGGKFNVGVLHTALGGREGHQNYAPCSKVDLTNKGYDYWALGHVHQSEIIHKNPHIVFSGNLQGRHIRETGKKGVYIVNVSNGQVLDLDMIECDDVRWAIVHVNIEECMNMPDIYECIRKEIVNTSENNSERKLLSCRVELQGNTELYEKLIISEESVLDNARALVLGIGNEVAWIEKIINKTRPVNIDETTKGSEEFIIELQSILDVAINEKEVLNQLEHNFKPLVNMLPAESRDVMEDNALKLVLQENYKILLERLGPKILAFTQEEDDSNEN